MKIIRKFKNNYFIIFFIISFCLMSFSFFQNINVNAVYTSLSNWDDVASGLDTGTSGLIAFKNTGTANNFETSSNYKVSGSNSFRVNSVSATQKGFWNLTETIISIEKINFHIYHASDTPSETTFMGFYDSSAHKVIEFSWRNGYYYWNDISIGDRTLCGYADYKWWEVTITHNGTNSFNIKIYNETDVLKGNYDWSGSYAGTYTTFSYLYFRSTGSSNCDAYIDNFNIDEEYTGINCWDELANYIPTGIDNTPDVGTVVGATIQHIYNVYTTGRLRAVSICVGSQMYAWFYNLTDYYCSILGDTWRSADCIQFVSPNYRIIWYCNYDLGEPIPNQQSGMMLYSTFYHQIHIPFTNEIHWYACMSSSDLDNDGDTQFKWDEGIGIENPQQIINFDLGVTYWLESPYVPPPDINLTDELIPMGYDFKNTSGYYYYMDNPNSMILDYTLSQQVYEDRIYLRYNDDTLRGNVSYEYLDLTYPSGEIYYPTVDCGTWILDDNSYMGKRVGKYYFTLFQNGYGTVASATCYFINRTQNRSYPSNFYIETRPSTTEPYQPYDIFYIYNHTGLYDGKIGVFSNFDDKNIFGSAYYSFDVDSIVDDIGRIFHFTQSYSLSNEYLTLFSFITPNYISVSSCTHFIKNPSAYWNEIFVDKATLEINKGNPEQRSIHIKGSHVYPVGNVHIFINGKDWTSVQFEQIFNKTFIPSVGGNYEASLVLMNGTNYIVLDTCSFTITIHMGGGGNGGDGGFNIIIPTPYNYFAGIFIILIFTLSPLIVLIGVGKSMGRDFNISSIPQFLYLITASVGFIITILFGWFPVWSIAVLIVISAVIIVILYLQKKGSITT